MTLSFHIVRTKVVVADLICMFVVHKFSSASIFFKFTYFDIKKRIFKVIFNGDTSYIKVVVLDKV